MSPLSLEAVPSRGALQKAAQDRHCPLSAPDSRLCPQQPSGSPAVVQPRRSTSSASAVDSAPSDADQQSLMHAPLLTRPTLHLFPVPWSLLIISPLLILFMTLASTITACVFSRLAMSAALHPMRLAARNKHHI